MEQVRFRNSGAFILAAALGCDAEGPKLDTWRGRHISYENDASFVACGGTHAWVDGFVPFVERELGVEVTDLLVYQWLREEDVPCPSETNVGCASGDVAWAKAPFVLHELVHTMMYTGGYTYHQPFFNEGLAYALDPWTGGGMGPRYLVNVKDAVTLEDPRDSMTLEAADLNYITAGSFVMFLLARHGPVPFLKFVRALGESRDMTIIKQTFAASYGIALDDEAELFMTGAACTPESFGPGLYDCTAEEMPWGDKKWSFKDVMDCSGDAVVGGGGWNSVRSVTLEVPTTGSYLVQGFGDDDVRMLIGPCSSCPWERRDHGGGMPFGDLVELEAGTHFVRVQGRSNEPSEFEISVLGPTP